MCSPLLEDDLAICLLHVRERKRQRRGTPHHLRAKIKIQRHLAREQQESSQNAGLFRFAIHIIGGGKRTRGAYQKHLVARLIDQKQAADCSAIANLLGGSGMNSDTGVAATTVKELCTLTSQSSSLRRTTSLDTSDAEFWSNRQLSNGVLHRVKIRTSGRKVTTPPARVEQKLRIRGHKACLPFRFRRIEIRGTGR